mgnify:CR=1 FL=1
MIKLEYTVTEKETGNIEVKREVIEDKAPKVEIDFNASDDLELDNLDEEDFEDEEGGEF